jgi:hypothetical protein
MTKGQQSKVDLKRNKKRASSPAATASHETSHLTSFLNNVKPHNNPLQSALHNTDNNGGQVLLESFLDAIDDITKGVKCSFNSNLQSSSQGPDQEIFLPKNLESVAQLPSLQWRIKSVSTAERVRLLSSIMSSYNPKVDSFKLLRNSLDQLVRQDKEFFRARIAWFQKDNQSFNYSFDSNLRAVQTHFFLNLDVKRRFSSEIPNRVVSLDEPYLRIEKNHFIQQLLKEGRIFVSKESSQDLLLSEWTSVYYSCELKKWMMSFTSLIVSDSEPNSGTTEIRLKGLISVDIDISNTDFNQCDEETYFSEQNPISMLGTHKCNRETSHVSHILFPRI